MRHVVTKFIVAVGLLGAGYAALCCYEAWVSTRHHVRELTALEAELALEFDLAIRQYVHDVIRPEMQRRLGPDEYVPEVMSAPFVARRVFDKVRERFPDYVIKFSSDNPRNAANRTGPEDLRMLQYFRDNPAAMRWQGDLQIGGTSYYALYSPSRSTESCRRCHGRPEDAPAALLERYGREAGFHHTAGSVMALDMVAIPTSQRNQVLAEEATWRMAKATMWLAGLLGGVFLAFRWAVGNRLAGMARHFREAAATDGKSPLQPIPVRGHDEIATLARAFNTLADRTRAVHDELEYRVKERTKDLSAEIAERKQAERALQASEQKYRTLFESSRDAIMTLAPPSWKFTSANRATVEMFQAQGEAEFISLGPWQVSPERQPDGRTSADKAKEMIETAMREGSHFFEWTHKRLHGEDYPATVLLTRIELDGQTLLQATVRDISVQKQAEQSLIAARENATRETLKLRSMIEGMAEGIVVADAADVVTDVNPWFLDKTGLRREDILGKSLWDLHPNTEDDARLRAVLDEFRRGQRREMHVVNRELLGMHLTLRVQPMFAGEEYRGIILNAIDVTDLEEARRAAETGKRKLEEQNEELISLNCAMTGREIRIVEMKREANALSAALGRRPPYAEVSAETEACERTELNGPVGPKRAKAVPAADHPIADNPALEKVELQVAYLPILCAAPLLYAASHGYFAKHGLKVHLQAASGWSGVKNLMAYGQVDASHMLSPMPLANCLGIDGRQADIRLVAVQNVNGQALTLSTRHKHIQDVRDMKGFTFGVPYRFSMHFYLLCTFLAEHGLDPLNDVTIREVAPSGMPFHLEKGWVDGVFAPEPFNQVCVYRGIGFIHTLSKDIWPWHPCCSLAASREFIERHPNTYRAMVRSVLEAELALHTAGPETRRSMGAEIAGPGFLNRPDEVEPIVQALCGEYADGRGNDCVDHDRMDFLPHPWPDYGTWMLTQMQRWNQLRRRVDYRQIAESVLVGETREWAEALGFEREPGPRLRKGSPCQAQSPFEAMRAQPFSAFSEEQDSGRLPAASDSERLQRLLHWAARFSGGREPGELPDMGRDAIAHLADLLRNIHTNTECARQVLQEQVELREKRVAERTADLERGRRAAVNLIADLNRAKEQLDGHVAALESANAALEKLHEKAEAASRAKSQFLANVSHEIRTPMTAILGFTDLLLDSLTTPEAIDAAQTVKRNGTHLLQLINDILDLSKIEAGRVEVDQIRWSPRQIVAEVVSLMHVRANAKGLTLREEYEGPLPETITTDPARLRQILVNLVGNAIKFTEAGGVRIVTRLLRHGGHEPKLRFEVLDTGIGIPETAIGKLFQPFTQVDASASRKYEGTGLGLTISRQLAWALGGDVTAQSEFGQGSTFTVTVPTGSLEGVRLVEYQTDARPTLGLPQESTATSWKKRACRVLLAEDIPDNQRLIGAMLREVGVDVTVANNGQEAVEKALATRPGWGRRAGDPREAFDVILMDIQMPVLDGYGATRRLRQEGYTGPIIALTAHAMRGDRQKCLDAGCDDYVSKPVDRKTLLETVARWGPAEEKQAEIAGSSPATCAQDFVAPCAHV